LRTFRPQRQNRYILMPESRFRHKNTIGLMWFFSVLGRCQKIAILRLTPPRSAHISAAPTANGAYRNIARNCDAGFFDPEVPGLPKGLDRQVVCSMHRLFGKGYAGGGDRQYLIFGSGVQMISSSLVRTRPTFGSGIVKSSDGIQMLLSSLRRGWRRR
jgi:hypothetical protein